MTPPIQHTSDTESNHFRQFLNQLEPRSLRTFTPSQAVLARSAGIYHWTPEGRRLYDFTSGVLVANLGHNPIDWMERFCHYMGWPKHMDHVDEARIAPVSERNHSTQELPHGFFSALTMTAYNGITPVEVEASHRLLDELQRYPGGHRLQQVMWAASGSEAIQKALWACMAFDRNRPMILATRHGFHGKKGLAGAVTGSENDPERDPRVRFISFPMKEYADITCRDKPFDPAPYQEELDSLWKQFGYRIGTLITEPYLGGGGSYHPPEAYLQLLQTFCREKGILFILDEVQANFGRTGCMFAYETYGLEPDMVVLGKGLGNGVPVAAVVGRRDVFAVMDYGEGSDTWSANPLCCAAVLATLDSFAKEDLLEHARRSSKIIEEGLLALKTYPFIAHVRGEKGGMVWGVETQDHDGWTANRWANEIVLACYRGVTGYEDGMHLLGPLAKKVIRFSPPLIISEKEALAAMDLLHTSVHQLRHTRTDSHSVGVIKS